MSAATDGLIKLGWPSSIANNPGLERQALVDFQGMNCFVSLNRARLNPDGVAGRQTMYLLDKAVEDLLCSPHFKYREFRSHSNPTWIDGSRYIIDHLEIMRYALHLDGVTIVSGHRTKEHNATVGGVPDSDHTGSDSSAVDIESDKVKMPYNTARELGFRGGIGIVIATGYTRHLDDGATRAWGYNAKGQAVAYTP